ncbi:hypothetical protein GCM10009105_09910 [Dokdonella soli]|uniref:XRE family transcriptional regulator n=1 Tax=Dokdonella soli TaxID=529810 RepID=A0ABP3TMS0_9GAMM
MQSVTFQLFEKWRAGKGYTSANAGCVALGVERACATHWKGGRNAEANVIERMARDLGEDPAAWILAAAAEKTIKADEQRTLLRLAKSLGYAAALFMFIGSGQLPIM